MNFEVWNYSNQSSSLHDYNGYHAKFGKSMSNECRLSQSNIHKNFKIIILYCVRNSIILCILFLCKEPNI